MAQCSFSCVDGINDFPDEVLIQIISFLPIKEAVRTSILSRKWRNLFSLISNLDIEMVSDDEESEESDEDEEDEEDMLEMFLKFVDRLVCRDTPPIRRFRLQCNNNTDLERVGMWLCCLLRHKIEELDLWYVKDIFDESLPLPPSLFSCQSLVVLKLNLRSDTYQLKLPDRVCLPHLQVLHLEAVEFTGDGSEERLFSSCPVLEDLVLSQCIISRGCVKVRVSNSNMKRLTLKIINSKEERSVDFLINAPSLVHLEYCISSFQSLVLQNVSLTKANIFPETLDFDGYVTTVSGLFRQIQNIHTLELHYLLLVNLEMFAAPLPLFNNMTCLKISDWQTLYLPSCLGYFLSHCIVLETLIIEGSDPYLSGGSFEILYILQKAELGPLLRRLKTIKLHVYYLEWINMFMEVIEFFLKNAKVLEEVNIYCTNPSQEVSSMRKLLSFPRVSEKCRVQCIPDNSYQSL